MLGVLVMMLSISPLMTLIALVILPVSAGLVSVVVKHSQKYFKSQQEYLGHINGQVEEVYGGHLVVKAFNREKDTLEEFHKTNDILYESAWKSQFFSALDAPDHDVCRKSRICGGCAFRRSACDQGRDYDRRYSGVYSVCEKLYIADPADCAGHQSGSVDGGGIRTCL